MDTRSIDNIKIKQNPISMLLKPERTKKGKEIKHLSLEEIKAAPKQ